MDSTLILYTACRIRPETNFVPEDLPSYLSSLVKVEVPDYQYVKFSPRLNLKVSLPQNSVVSSFKYSFNYLSIKNSDWSPWPSPAYFFIESMKWLGRQTIELSCSIDVLNTFNSTIRGKDAYGPKTRVFREHRNRYRWSSVLSKYVPVIDRVPENMGFPLVKTGVRPIVDATAKQPFSVLYYAESTDEDAPVNVAFVPSYNGISVAVPDVTGDGVFPQSFEKYANDDVFYVCKELNHYNDDAVITCSWRLSDKTYDTAAKSLGEKTYSSAGRPVESLAYRLHIVNKNVNNKSIYAKLYVMFYHTEDGTFSHEEMVDEIQAYPASDTLSLDYFYFTSANVFEKGSYPDDSPTSLRSIYAKEKLGMDGAVAGTGKAETIYLKEVSRTAPTLQKLVNVPYFPKSLSVSDGLFTLPEGYVLSIGKILFVDVGSSGSDYFEVDFSSFEIPDQYRTIDGIAEMEAPKLRDGSRETKILSSEFFYYKVVYDSFSLVLEGENLPSFNPKIDPTIAFEFFFSTEFSSAFLLKVTPLSADTWSEDIVKEDFPFLLSASRNNESVVYTSSYLNYVKTGYNYDVKNKSLNELNNALGVLLSAINYGAGTAQAFVSQNAGLPGLLSSTAGFASNVYQGFEGKWRSEMAFAQRIRELKAQGASMSSVGDYSLMRTYNGDFANLMSYGIDPIYKEEAITFLELYGYATEKIGVPALHTRGRWNFVQCEIDLNTEWGANLPEWAKELVKAKFSEGVTFLHRSTDLEGTTQSYLDFGMKLENYDVEEEKYL